MKEFDPRSERHYPLFAVKAVEPGCTTELQLENQQTGEIVRLTTTDDSQADRAEFFHAVRKMAEKAWEKYQETEHEQGTTATS